MNVPNFVLVFVLSPIVIIVVYNLLPIIYVGFGVLFIEDFWSFLWFCLISLRCCYLANVSMLFCPLDYLPRGIIAFLIILHGLWLYLWAFIYYFLDFPSSSWGSMMILGRGTLEIYNFRVLYIFLRRGIFSYRPRLSE